jgi:hypothetical protein
VAKLQVEAGRMMAETHQMLVENARQNGKFCPKSGKI